MMLALDIGGTKTSLALLDDKLQVVEKKSIATEFSNWQDYAAALSVLTSDWRFETVAVATTGRIVDGVLQPLNTDMISFWAGFPIKAKLESFFAKPVFVINDAAAAAWGEYRHLAQGADNSVENLLYLTVSTGVGSGLILNRQLVTSANGLGSHAGHSQHSLSDVEEIQCSCGRYNCVETIASGTAISTRASQACGEALTTIEVFSRYESDARCASVINQSAQVISELITNINAIVGLDIVVLGGGVGLNEHFQALVRNYLSSLPAAYKTPIASAALGVDSGLYGGAALAPSH
ncbi:ROK family protein [Reinekea sp.]|jgi:N-acylmannosamine kinase|uniref:ROK family protein n=1 Tax=Reinekea sp. TaxID=1970455 RepID=UPI003989154B